MAAEPDLKACVTSYEAGQKKLRHAELLGAREALSMCARAPCPEQMWGDCARWLGEVEQRMPSVVLAALDRSGRDVTGVIVFVDGKPIPDRLLSHAIEVDPGAHVFRFQPGDRAPVEEHVLVREGEKARAVTVHLEQATTALSTPEKAAPVAPAQPSHVGAYALGGIGVVGLAVFGTLGLLGRAEYFDLKAPCSPACSSSDVAPARTKLLLADVALGVSLVALGAAAYLYFTGREVSTAHGGRAERIRFDLEARGGDGARASFRMAF